MVWVFIDDAAAGYVVDKFHPYDCTCEGLEPVELLSDLRCSSFRSLLASVLDLMSGELRLLTKPNASQLRSCSAFAGPRLDQFALELSNGPRNWHRGIGTAELAPRILSRRFPWADVVSRTLKWTPLSETTRNVLSKSLMLRAKRSSH